MSGENNSSDEECLPFFFYGTLRRGQHNYSLLRGYTVSEEPARAENMDLYSLRAFPMMVYGNGSVHGELVRFDPHLYDEILQRLDNLEGYRPEVVQQSIYCRAKIPVQVESTNQTALAWAYVGVLDCLKAKYTPIPEGDWVQYQTNLMMQTRFGRFIQKCQ